MIKLVAKNAFRKVIISSILIINGLCSKKKKSSIIF